MLVPSKFTTLEESTIYKMISILSNREEGESISELLNRTSEQFTDTSELIHALDILYVLDLLNIDQSGNIKYAP